MQVLPCVVEGSKGGGTMSRAEELSLKAYPISTSYLSESNGDGDRNHPRRLAFIEGYEQAKKDTLEMAVNWLQSRLNKQGFLDYDDIFDLRSLIVEL